MLLLNQFCHFLVKNSHCAEFGPTCHLISAEISIAAATLLLRKSTVQIQTAAHLRHSCADAHTRYLLYKCIEACVESASTS